MINMLSSRYDHLKLGLAGLQKTGVPLVEFDGTQFLPAAFADDIGIYVLIPKLALWLNISLDQAITLFFSTITIGSGIIGLLGFFCIYSSWKNRLIAAVGVLSLTQTILVMASDVYCIPAAVAIAVSPWALYFFYDNKGTTYAAHAFLFATGIACGTTHFIRSYGFGSVALFTTLLIVGAWKQNWLTKATTCLMCALGALIPWYYFHACMSHYATFIHATVPQYDHVVIQHPFWHNVYIGLGFLSNSFGITYNDSVSFNKVVSVVPDIIKNSVPNGFSYDERYDSVLRHEVLTFIKQHPMYMLQLLFAKAGVIFLYVLRYANVGFITLFIAPLPYQLVIAFTFALGWGALPGFLAIPTIPAYLLSLIAFAWLFNIISFNHFLNTWNVSSFRAKFSKLSLRGLLSRDSL